MGRTITNLVLSALCLSSIASASSLAVANFSFENPVQASGTFSNNSITSWVGVVQGTTVNNLYGVLRPVVGTQVNSVPDGNQVVYMHANNTADEILNQDLTGNGLGNPSIAANTIYTLTVDIGARTGSGVDPFGGSIIHLIDSTNNTNISINFNCATPTAGNFITCTTSFDSANFAANIGHHLGVQLQIPPGSSSTMSETLFDNVRVTAVSTVPEPSTITMVMLGVALAGVRCFRTKSAQKA